MKRWLLLVLLALPWALAAQSTPEETIIAFQRAVDSHRLDRAARLMDTSGLPESGRFGRAQRDALRLSTLLRRPEVQRKRPLRAPRGQSSFVVAEFTSPSDQTPLGRIGLTRLADGRWVFDSETVESIRPMYQAFVDEALSEGRQGDGETTIYTTPRAAFFAFLTAMADGDPDAAGRLFDVGDQVEVVREAEARKAANRLHAVLNRTRWVTLQEVPTEASSPWVFERYADEDSGQPAGRIALAKGEDGGWRFDTQTVRELPAIWEVVKSWPVVGGLGETAVAAPEADEWVREQLPSVLTREWRGVALWHIVALVALLASAWLISSVAKWIVLAIVRKTHASLLAKRAGSAVALLVSGLAVAGLMPLVSWPTALEVALTIAYRVAILFGLAWVASLVWEGACRVVLSKAATISARASSLLIPIAVRFGKIGAIAAATIAFMASVGIDVTTLVAGLGLGGALLALAAKDSVENVFGAFTVLLERPFAIGDWIRIAGVEGTVEDISVRSTLIRTFEDSLVLIPNSHLIKNPIENLGVRRWRRIRTTISLAPDATADKVEAFVQRVRDLVMEHPSTRKDRVHVHFNDFGEGNLQVLLYTFVEAETWEEELVFRETLMVGIWKTAEEVGVRLAVLLAPPTGPTPPDRPDEEAKPDPS